VEEQPKLNLAERVALLESRQDQLEADWDGVLSRFQQRLAREAQIKRKEVMRTLEASAGESPADGQPEALPDIPSKAELWRRARKA